VQLEKVIEEGIRLAEAKNTRGPVTIRIGKISDMIVMGDESKLKRCVMNLVSNAIEALLDQKISNPSIDITATTGDGTMLISIRDNGKGIPTEILRSLFEPFVTRQKTNGTGLGLAIVKQYITAHDGEIWVENDNGAVFTIALPL
jgi:C4-dicarboxylate-specific signal transduction histidine kinase